MSLQSRLLDDMKSAMRAKDALSLETIRFIRSAIQRREIDIQKKLDDQQVINVIKKLIKQSQDSERFFSQGGRDVLAEKERVQIEIFSRYLPTQLDEVELDILVESAINKAEATKLQDIGRVMSILNHEAYGQFDASIASQLVKHKLGSS